MSQLQRRRGPDLSLTPASRVISPTDIAQHVHLGNCERYLRLRLVARSDNYQFMRDEGVQPQKLPQVLRRSGLNFEHEVQEAIAKLYRLVPFAGNVTDDDNQRLLNVVGDLGPDETVVIAQPAILAKLEGWEFQGVIDIARFHRRADGQLGILIADIKSSRTDKMEHLLQVACYVEMIRSLFEPTPEEIADIKLGILYRGLPHLENDVPSDVIEEMKIDRKNAEDWFGIDFGLLSIPSFADDLIDQLYANYLAPGSKGDRAATETFESIPYVLDSHCDTCTFNAFCMKWATTHDDLAAVPFTTGPDINILHKHGIMTASDLAHLKEPTPDRSSELQPAPEKEKVIEELSVSQPLGPRLDELIHRARRYRWSRGEDIASQSWIPDRGYSSLPHSAPDHNANLVTVYLDAQSDYVNDRLYMVGALVIANDKGTPYARRSIVRMTTNEPSNPEIERDLLNDWVQETLRAIVTLPASDDAGGRTAPIHLVFYNDEVQRLLLLGLARHLDSILDAAPLYSFITQQAAYDSPLISVLQTEIRRTRNYPMRCQSLTAVAHHLRFDWNSPLPFTDLFKTRLFDDRHPLPEEDVPEGERTWFNSRARFSSAIPLEYATTVWDEYIADDEADDNETYDSATYTNLRALMTRRLEALEYIASKLKGNPWTTKTSFELPKLSEFDGEAKDLAAALDEFVMIERHVELGNWKRSVLANPELRVLAGDSLLLRYRDALQDTDTRIAIREHRKRAHLEDELLTAYRAAHPDETDVDYKVLSEDQRKRTKRSLSGLTVTFEITDDGVACNLDEIMRLTSIREGSWALISPRWTTDSRLPLEERVPITPTYKRLLYDARADVKRINLERDGEHRVISARIDVEYQRPIYGNEMYPFVFSSGLGDNTPLEDGELFVIDDNPNSFNDYHISRVIKALPDHKNVHALYTRLTGKIPTKLEVPDAAIAAQQRFLKGFERLAELGHFHEFEESKRQYIGRHGTTPTLLVQGPPGTGKSYATAFAMFARAQGAMAAGQRFHAGLSCHTHAATDVLVSELVNVRDSLRIIQNRHEAIFNEFFDLALLDIPIFRLLHKGGTPPDGSKLLASAYRRELGKHDQAFVLGTPSKMRDFSIAQRKGKKHPFGHEFLDCIVLDEASQLTIPGALMATVGLKMDGQLIVVGDHRQMAPIIKHDWERDLRRSSHLFRSYDSIFNRLRAESTPMVQFEESFRLHRDMADFLRETIYQQDGIRYFSRKAKLVDDIPSGAPFFDAVLGPGHPIVVIEHNEELSQKRNEFEAEIIAQLNMLLRQPHGHNLNTTDGVGTVVPHKAQRALIQDMLMPISEVNPSTGVVRESGVDTVERYQGDEREVIIFGATESDSIYLQSMSEFLLDPRRLTVALSRAQKKVILIASRHIFNYFSTDEEIFKNSLLWRHLLKRTCTELLWSGQRNGHDIKVWGSPARD